MDWHLQDFAICFFPDVGGDFLTNKVGENVTDEDTDETSNGKEKEGQTSEVSCGPTIGYDIGVSTLQIEEGGNDEWQEDAEDGVDQTIE